ncbi:SDR family NAD(P)-dependent oxidoreductase [Amycolatopsis jiangsuensis]|uniref:NAD(P)-dependent dehydrogenase (Short-subunit alcohol dehydrogenase family) n=1 Tax=Amycolatopsis jiangsuensis TaxID=1181879 RepID=A0A840J3D2_9PSEU|nr:SDR family oxidoreductase [Amycolatopsis jiangsuensis]MBB4689571.1 NAD(P)-dependent dehydrogenase (short-subunit alcohol dehydrogenase family) [Amycolatopsis jiangsuensis]
MSREEPMDGRSGWLDTGVFAGQVGVVTGGGRGIGRSVSLSLAAAGCEVVVADVDADLAADTAAEAGERGGKARAATLDVTDAAAVSAFVEAEARVDKVVNCAGMLRAAAVAELNPVDWAAVFELNVQGVLNVARAVHPRLSASPVSAMVNIGSLSGTSAYPGGGAYGPSKAALIALTHQLAAEWGRDGIRVNVVNPGPTKTPLLVSTQSPGAVARREAQSLLGSIPEPQNIADAVLYLLSPGAAAVTGQALNVDCGLSQTVMDGPASWSARS